MLSALALALGAIGQEVHAQQPLSLDSCRNMALKNNKKLRIAAHEIEKAGYQKKEAFAAYLPALDFAGGYTWNQKKISIFDSDQMLPTKSFNPQTQSYEFNLVTNPETHEPIQGPDGQYIPETVALIPKKAMEYDIHNVFFGAVTLTQPIFMGGKIRAMNKITGFAEELARQMHDSQAENTVYEVDAAYWQVVSLGAKKQLAESYLCLLDTLHYNVNAMVEQGVATPSDLLTVEVRQNSAQVDLVKVDDGLRLSRMALAQLCGLPVDSPMLLADENTDISSTTSDVIPAQSYDMNEVYARRHDLEALELGVKIRGEQANVARAELMPQLALVGAYTFSNPNMFDGFKKRFDGAFSVGAMLTVPLWHWGGNYNRYKAAKSDITIARLQLEDAKEMISLQVSQAAFRCREAVKTHQMTVTNITKADENLRQAELGYREGVMTLTTVMEAQTAWLKAYSERIDADIDVRLCDVYLTKVLGQMNY